MPSRHSLDLVALADRASGLIAARERSILGIAGSPGSGKSYLAAQLVRELINRPPRGTSGHEWVAYLPMDGFHLANNELRRLGRDHRKGAPDTFDGFGYAELLTRLRHPSDHVIYAPSFDRTLDESVAGSIAIPPEVRLVVTEGNYLLLPAQPWTLVRQQLDEVWFCDTDEDRRMRQLVRRHIHFGKSAAEAEAWASSSDEANAEQIRASRASADLFVSEETLRSLTRGLGASPVDHQQPSAVSQALATLAQTTD